MAIRATQDAPAEVLCVLLSRPSGWAGCVSISRTITTGLKRRLAVFRGRYDRDAAQEAWVNHRPFDRSGDVLFKNQPPAVRALVIERWADL
eukprot:1067686-Alexandrium_andersonii.AAC.1